MNQIISEPVQKYMNVGAGVGAKTLDACSWRQSRSLKFEFRLHSPALAYCSLQYKNAFAMRNLFLVL